MQSITVIDPEKDSRWDEFVRNHELGLFCHQSGWKRVLESTFPHMRGHYFSLVDEGGRISAALPLFLVRSWLTGSRLVSIPFATLTDPLVSNQDQLISLLQAALELSKELNDCRVEIRTLHSDFAGCYPQFQSDRFFKHHYLMLDADPDDLKRRFHYKAVRYEINRANKSGLQMKVAESDHDLREFYGVYKRTRKRLALPSVPYRFFDTLWKTFQPTGTVELLLGVYEGRTIAGQLYFKFRDRVSMEFEAWDREFKSFAPNHYLIWEAIKTAHGQGYRIFDFGRTSPRNTELMNFKKRWGTQMVDLPQFLYPRKAFLSKSYQGDSSVYKLVQKACRYSPGFALEALGAICYRHLS